MSNPDPNADPNPNPKPNLPTVKPFPNRSSQSQTTAAYSSPNSRYYPSAASVTSAAAPTPTTCPPPNPTPFGNPAANPNLKTTASAMTSAAPATTPASTAPSSNPTITASSSNTNPNPQSSAKSALVSEEETYPCACNVGLYIWMQCCFYNTPRTRVKVSVEEAKAREKGGTKVRVSQGRL